MDPISLSIFSSRIESICDEMGALLQRVAFSPNIKDRLDYSCAVFDPAGELCAQAAHIPVHLGSMAYAMKSIVQDVDWQSGDMLILNDPYLGGTHLPDVTLIAPLFVENRLLGFVANRAHHADIGADSPGSMPISRQLSEEGMVIGPQKILEKGQMQQTLVARLMAGLRNPEDSMADFRAQISANQRGVSRLQSWVASLGADAYLQSLQALNDYGEKLATSVLASLPDGEYRFRDFMDDDGLGHKDIAIQLSLHIQQGRVSLDFGGTSAQVDGNINCPLSVVAAAVYYVFRCLMPDYIPACAGSFRPIHISAPEGSLLNARYPAAVAAGNVETSSRVVDVVMGALAQAAPALIPAAAQGTMNNLAMGAEASGEQPAWDYYETIGGGMGASAQGNGLSGVQTHMTNTLNTPIEALEMAYPLRLTQYALRKDAGGKGRHCGGDGLIREYEFLADSCFTLLTERRRYAPWGLNGGEDGRCGHNLFNGKEQAGKVSLCARAGDRLLIETPGGGGYGQGDF